MDDVLKIPDPLLRAIAIAVQGIMNRYPRRTAESLDYMRRISVRRWSAQRSSLYSYALDLDSPPPKGRQLTYIPNSDGSYRWIVKVEGPKAEWAERSAGEAEKIVADAFTRPFVVSHVTDKALSIARRIADVGVGWGMVEV